MVSLLHEENLSRIYLVGLRLRNRLEKRVCEIKIDTEGKRDPNITILIRTKNDMGTLPALIADIKAQAYDGKVEIILVDTSSTDGTVTYAASQGVRVITLTQASFTYPRALNLGFETASHDYVMTLVGHSSLSNTMMLKCLTRWYREPVFAGIYNLPLPAGHASRSERLASAVWMAHRSNSPEIEKVAHPGLLAANSSIVSRLAWKRLGGYDERFAGGGEDTALGRSMLEAGMTIICEPAFSVFHSHGLGLRDGIKQIKHWREVAGPDPQSFDSEKVMDRRPDLRQKDRL
jgi:N-acetylglucosaminyl-diphospho-decaprenol L-rhamnosyltransferase